MKGLSNEPRFENYTFLRFYNDHLLTPLLTSSGLLIVAGIYRRHVPCGERGCDFSLPSSLSLSLSLSLVYSRKERSSLEGARKQPHMRGAP